MLDVIQNHTFVGMADSVLSLLQHGTRLYLANTPAITREMFYQQVAPSNNYDSCSSSGCKMLSPHQQ